MLVAGDVTHYNVRAHEVAYETGGIYLPSWGTEHFQKERQEGGALRG